MTDRHPLDGPDTDWGREITRRQDSVEKRTDERHAENQESTKYLSDEVLKTRKAMEAQAYELTHFRDEAMEKWRRVDRNQGIFERFIDDWEGRPGEGKIGLGIQLRTMVGEWGQLRWVSRIIIALITTLASGIGFLLARYLESHK